MTKALLGCFMLLVSCDAISSFFETTEKVLTDEAVKVEVYKGAIPEGDKLEADIKIVPNETPLSPP